MSGLDNKKAKRRKVKKGAVTKAPNQTGQKSASAPSDASPPVDHGETLKKLERLMDAEEEASRIFTCANNPFLNKDRCLLCHCERQDPPDIDKIKAALGVSEFEDLQATIDSNPLAQLPLWVCPSCRKAADQEMEKKPSIEQFMEPDLEDSFLSDINIKTGSEPTTPNGSICNCEACTERRAIESELEQETVELQQCWADLRKVVRCLYGCRDNSEELLRSLPDDEMVKEQVHKLCRRDPHQLFLRLESQVREFVIEMKVKLLKQLSNGFKTPPQAKTFISMLLEEYAHLCKIARRMSGLLKELQDHLKRFKVTWDLHNKHLFQSIVFSEPSIKNSMNLLTQQLRLGAASKETCHEDTYPNLLHRYLKFEDEMSVINVVWRDCHQLIENYNEEQSVLKLKQKMLREDWELFKTQRKLLEQQVSKNPKATISHNLEAQFTETMRLMLQGNKPSTEELICPRCNSKRCPCDECTITHMITCGIINPEVLDHAANTTGHHHNANFLHDSNKYRIDVSPPSMSSTTSSSGSSSPIMVDPERLKGFSENNQNEEEIQEEIDNQSYDDEEDDDEDDEEDDEDEDADNEEEEEESKDVNVDGLPPIKIPNMMELTLPPLLNPEEAMRSGDKLDSCNCDHCVSQSKLEKVMKSEDNQCQCHVCLQQQGKAISTSLPQHIPPIPRPGELHLYPHIHGSSGLHSLGRGHVRPLLQPSLYDLHLPSTQRHKSIIHQAKVPIKLDFDTPEGMNDHIYHAYGDWDNTSYDPRLLLGSGKFDSELLPPPPFSSPYTSSLLSEPLPMSVPGLISSSSGSVISSVSSTSAFTSTFTNHSSAAASIQASTKITDNLSVLTTKESLGEQVSNKFSKCANQSGSPSKNHNPPWVRPATLGGNNMPKVQEKPHSQHCRKHSAQANTKTGSLPNHNHGTQLPMKMTPEFMQSKEGRQMMQLANSLKQPNGNNHPCNHSNKASNHTGGGKDGHQGMGTCVNAIQLPTSVNNVSVSTSTVCTEPDCDGNHDDNYDSIDDNCSEKSSSTSNSTSQKEGKYCDCCYCEFFGHGNPPVAPTSKNYAEMRDKLRLRLKKKTEGKPDDPSLANSKCTMIDLHSKNCTMAASLPNKPPTPSCDTEEKPVETRGLDELIKFINGTDQDSQGKQLSQKAAKRARQKQRKAIEKKRQEEEKLRAEKLEAERKQQEELMKAKLQEAAAAAAAAVGAEMAKSEGMTKKQKKQAARQQQAKSSIISTPSTPTAPCNTASQDITSTAASAQERLAASTSSKTLKKKGKHKEEDGQKLQVNITCEIEHSPDVTVNKVGKLSQPHLSNCTHNSQQSASNNTSAKQQKTNNNRPAPQGSSEPIVLPENDNRNKMDIRPNKNKDIGKNMHLGNGDFMKSEQVCQQATIQQQQELLKKKIQLQFQQEAKKQIHVAQQQQFQEQIKQQQQLLAQVNKGRRGSGKVTPDLKLQQSNQTDVAAKSQTQQPLNDKQLKTTGKNPSKTSVGTPTLTQSPRIQEQNNNTKQGKMINGGTITQSSQTTTQSQSKKARKQADNIQQNSGSNQSPRQTPSPIATSQQNGSRSPTKALGQVRQPPQGQAKSTDPSPAQDSKKDQGKQGKQEDSPPFDQVKSGKNKKMKKKSKGSDINFIDEVFMPKSESDIEDEFEREIEEFKRFCADSTTPVRREKLQVNVNIKDIFAKKKNGLSVGS